MKDWDALYKEKGIVQEKPSKFVIKAVEFLKKQNLEKILDLGCGTGRHITYLLQKGFRVYGCDSSENALKIAKEIIPEAEFRTCDMTSLPYENNFFDGVICHFVIQHGKIADIKKAVSEIYRVLRNGGILYLSVISTEHSEYSTGEEIEPNTRINIDAIDGKEPHHYFTENEMKNLFSNFEILKLNHVESPSEKDPDKKMGFYTLYAKKQMIR
jgi:ubiquinone/menaquinone biosynthesis C-methylase UbiE